MIPSLKTLAEELGLSQAAVSLALRNHPRISKETRAKVKALAKRRGYVPNPAYRRSGALRSRAKRENMPVALLVQPHPEAGWGISTCEESVSRVASSFGYRMQLHEVNRHNAAKIGSILYARGVEAVLIGRIFHKSFLRDFPWKLFSVVAMDAGYELPPCHTVLPDIARATVAAVDKALAAGYSRIGLYEFSEKVEPLDWVDRIGAAGLAAERCQKARAGFFHHLGPSYDQKAFADWLLETKPDVVIGQTPSCYWWMREILGSNSPASLSLQMDPSEKDHGIAGFIHDTMNLASLAMKLLDTEVRNYERGKPAIPARLLVTMPFFAGKTFKPLRSKARRRSA